METFEEANPNTDKELLEVDEHKLVPHISPNSISSSASPNEKKQLKRKGSKQMQIGVPLPNKVSMEKVKCNISDTSYTEGGSLKIHSASVHEKKKSHKCTVCDATFAQYGLSLIHI